MYHWFKMNSHLHSIETSSVHLLNWMNTWCDQTMNQTVYDLVNYAKKSKLYLYMSITDSSPYKIRVPGKRAIHISHLVSRQRLRHHTEKCAKILSVTMMQNPI